MTATPFSQNVVDVRCREILPDLVKAPDTLSRSYISRGYAPDEPCGHAGYVP